jgi:lipopolysaccharide biosynthesis regulator YciM
MSVPRRRLLRPVPAENGQMLKRIQDLRARLGREQASLSRWMKRLRRAFHSVEKQQSLIARLERHMRQLEEN